MSGLLAGKRLLITGVITESSIAFDVAKIAQQQGATVVLTGFGRMSLVERIAKRLPEPPVVLELDVTNQEHLDSLADRVREHVDGLDGVLHSIGFAPASCLSGEYLDTPWEDVSTAMHVSAYSYAALTKACLPLMGRGGSIVGLDFDARFAWQNYNWMGAAKAALESINRYLAREMGRLHGIRVNLVAAGPIRSTAARSIPNFDSMEGQWNARAPLGWDPTDREPTARTCCVLLSDWMPATTGTMVWADGGFSAIGDRVDPFEAEPKT
ncbi:enoyl-ACP reductase FabI [Allokutzneria sp. A3M-2-11 16]|uniref:enoyl-ACP reductase FabI n=1 Tax=Allokutzneria sp. A3M-2-11 16 TaxID=2962043 RepID=UPI0020B71AD0|nr:enoyl-ACP reductase FabI [Allokutzneria sp. A3M-2-11 16]MCP3802257.1 enoyl-ACP reductase FabI [Allokutzneria sp. A3M-2-11 16]